jgi:hypothetical protein
MSKWEAVTLVPKLEISHRISESPGILDLEMASNTPLPLHPRAKNSCTQQTEGFVGPRVSLEVKVKFLSLPGIESR